MSRFPIPDGHTVYRLDIEYDGTDFAGWQLQDKDRTVQGVLETALTPLFQDKPRVIGSGRTDAGVHASGQVAHFVTGFYRDPPVVHAALQGSLPPDVNIVACSQAPSDFHSRFNARWRGYDYCISQRRRAIGRHYCWILSDEFDIRVLTELASELIGTHCFRAFAHTTEKETHYLSTVFRSEWNFKEGEAVYRIEANRFLHGMIRFLVGTMMDAARNRIQIQGMRELIVSEDMTRIGMKAPACGLTLRGVGYRDWPEL